MNQDNTYRTSDTTLGAFLVTAQFVLLYIDYSKPRYEFVFPDSQEIQTSVNKYITGTALTDPSTFSRVNRRLLRVIRKQCQWEED